jgi:hypothetical protein
MLLERFCTQWTAAARIWVAVAWIAVTLAGCGTESCWGLERGHTYSFILKEATPKGARAPVGMPCAASLPPAVNDTLKLRVIDEHQTAGAADCNEAVGELAGEHGLNIVDGPLWEGGGVRIGAGSGAYIIRTAVFIDWNGCRGTWAVAVLGSSDDKDPFVKYRAGDPVVVLYRVFTPDPAFLAENPTVSSMCTSCADHFGVQVTK